MDNLRGFIKGLIYTVWARQNHRNRLVLGWEASPPLGLKDGDERRPTGAVVLGHLQPAHSSQLEGVRVRGDTTLILPALISCWCLCWLDLPPADRKPPDQVRGEGAEGPCGSPETGQVLRGLYRGLLSLLQWTWSFAELFPLLPYSSSPGFF